MINHAENINLPALRALPAVNYWCKSPDGIITEVNEASARFIQVKHLRDCIGQHQAEYLSPAENAETTQNDALTLKQNTAMLHYEFSETPTMARTSALSIKAPIITKQSETIGTCGISVFLKDLSYQEALTHLIKAAPLMGIEVNPRFLFQIAKLSFQMDEFSAQWQKERPLFSYDNLQFTMREAQVLHHVLQNRSATQVSEATQLSRKTIEWYIAGIKQKLGVYNKSQIFQKAMEMGFIELIFMNV